MQKKIYSIILCICIFSASLAIFTTDSNATIYKNTNNYKKATYTIAGNSNNFYYKKKTNKTYATTTMQWNYNYDWKDVPAFQFTDTIAMTTGQNFTIYQTYKCKDNVCLSKNKSTCSVTYKPEFYKSGITWIAIESAPKELQKAVKSKKINCSVKTKSSGKAVYSNIPLKKNYSYTIKEKNSKGKYIKKTYTVCHYATNGTMTTKWWKSKKENAITMSANYGHSSIGMTPKVSTSGIDIDFSVGTSYGSEVVSTIPKVRTVK